MNMNIKGLKFTNVYAKGSCADRNQTLQTIRQNIYNGIVQHFNDKTNISLRELEALSKNNMPEKLKYTVKKISQKLSGYDGCLKNYFDDEGITKYRIEIPAKNGKVDINYIQTFMHEITHLLYYALNPKIISCYGKLCKKLLLDRVYDFYFDNYYKSIEKVPLNKVKRNTRSFLRDNNTENKLLMLRYIKYHMESEANAYEATKQYSERVNLDFGRNIVCHEDIIEAFKFNDKLEIINKFIYKVISKERRKHNSPFYRLKKCFSK